MWHLRKVYLALGSETLLFKIYSHTMYLLTLKAEARIYYLYFAQRNIGSA